MLQPVHLANDSVILAPLAATDFEGVYAVASDPLIWEQHPNPDRYKREVFQTYFEGALASRGAFLILSAKDQAVIGCTRYYDHVPERSEIKIGYTFFSRQCWGRAYNLATKSLMLDHAFTFVQKVIFHVGAANMRSRAAMAKLGARHTGDETVTYYGELPRLNCVFEIDSALWKTTKPLVESAIRRQAAGG
jgi:RimJ/RimL family protein N-acetyltransferase